MNNQKWKKVLEDNWDAAFDAVTAAYRKSIECGKIDACEGQAFQAANSVLMYEDGTIETLRHAPGLLLGDVKAGRAIELARYHDWTADGFVLAEEEDPEDIDIDELMFGFCAGDVLNHVMEQLVEGGEEDGILRC